MTEPLQHARISGVIYEGFRCEDTHGRPLKLALVDDTGNIVEAGPAVEEAAWDVCIQVQENFWRGEGHLRVLKEPPPTPLKVAS